MFELWKEFKFDAAHTLEPGQGGDDRYRRIHGHSYQAEVCIRGTRQPGGWVMDMGVLESRLGKVASELDHTHLNEIEELGPPTMENLAAFIWLRLSDLKGLYRVVVKRESSKEGCTFFGDSPEAVA